MNKAPVLIGLLVIGSSILACSRPLTLSPSKPLSASEVAKDFKSLGETAAKEKYGTDVTLRGFTWNKGEILEKLEGGMMETGSINLGEGKDTVNVISCEFSRNDLPDFQKVKGEQYVTVRGTLAVERKMVRLTYCKLVSVDDPKSGASPK